MSVAALFAVPFAAYGAGDKADKASSASSMFKSMDKNQDGFVSREEATGTPHEKDFATLDKNSDSQARQTV